MANTNIGLSFVNGLTAQYAGEAESWIRRKLASAFSDNEPVHVRFYYHDTGEEGGGSILKVLAKKTIRDAAAMATNEIQYQYQEALNEGINKMRKKLGLVKDGKKEWAAKKLIEDSAIDQHDKYGSIDGVEAVDAFGFKCSDALMLAIPIDYTITYKRERYDIPNSEPVKAMNKLIWSDCTALISVDSEKNLILTKVSGRDYTRKELVSNGDLNFSVSGHLMSNLPEVMPINEMQKFMQIMKYKGIVEVNNPIFGAYNVTKIVIKNFNITTKEGETDRQYYTFTAVGIQPDTEVQVKNDTIYVIDAALKETEGTDENKWKSLLAGKAEAIMNSSADLLNQATAYSFGKFDESMEGL